MFLNETPVRTSKNYGINNMELKEIELPKHIEEFNSLSITGDTANFEISNNAREEQLAYGNGKELEDLCNTNSNRNLNIEEKKSGTLNLEFNLNEEDVNLIENIEIELNTKSKTTIVIKYTSSEELCYFHNGIIRVNAKKDSKTDIVIVNMLNNKSNNFLSIETTLEENAIANFCIVDFGGKTSTETNIEVQGALNGDSKKNFKGTIDFKHGCKKAKGYENEFCMLLSDKAKSKALPMLLCTEEDVEGNHSTACGKVDNQQLFYIMSRGLSYNDAMKLIVKAKFNKIIETIKDEELKEDISNEIDRRLN